MELCAEIQNLSVSFHSRQAVSGINATLPSEGITVLIGRSGSGKTTFLRALNRLNETFDGYEGSGSIRLLLGGEMKDIYSSGTLTTTDLRRKVGMVFQTPNPLPMSIRRNIMLPLQLIPGFNSRSQTEDRMETALKTTGLWNEVKDRLDTPANRLSGGQQQRLCLARALALEPEILLLDEPTASLDKRSSELIEDHLISLKKRYSILMVSHSVRQALKLGSYFILLKNGIVVASFPKEEIPEGKDVEKAVAELL